MQGRHLPAADYTANDGQTITFATGTFAGGENVTVVGWSAFVDSTATFRAVGEATLTKGQSSIAWSYTPGAIDVRINGCTLSITDYTATDGQNIVFANIVCEAWLNIH